MVQLAQLNIARMKFVPEGPEMQDFTDALDPVNATADVSPGFVWRMVSDVNPSASLRKFEQSGWLVNMSVWQSLADLRAFVSSSLHLSIMRRRAEWFETMGEATMVLWWVADGRQPDFEEAMQRLSHLRRHGPSSYAFSFSNPFDASGA